MTIGKAATAVLWAMSFSASVLAADPGDAAKNIQTMLRAEFGREADAIRKAGVLNLYEIQVGNRIYYADEQGRYFFDGSISDLKARINLTEERVREISRIKFADLPLELALKTVRGNGKRVYATFEDPNCRYCQQLAEESAGMSDYTRYTFMLAILGSDSKTKVADIWCAPDRTRAWNDWMVRKVAPPAAKSGCNAPVDALNKLGARFEVAGTPTIFLSDGMRIPGRVPVTQLEQALNKVAR